MNILGFLKNQSPRTCMTLAAICTASPLVAHAQNAGNDQIREEDTVVVLGSRRAERSVGDIPAPVDVISGDDLARGGASSDIQNLLRTSVPSYNVRPEPISDGASVIRPANLRGLSPDNTLILLNGKRRHRGSVITFIGHGISDGAQAVDVSVIPSIAIKQVEVLRDGASSQYGSDAIAGVINFELKDAPNGQTFEAKYGSTYKGDGDNYRFGANIGLPIADNGFINASAEFGQREDTIRAIQRSDAQALIDAGNTAVATLNTNLVSTEYALPWGNPELRDEIQIFINSGYNVSENAQIYAFGNYAQRTVEGTFYYRNPTSRSGVYQGPWVDAAGTAVPLDAQGNPLDPTNAFPSVRVGDLDGLQSGGACPAGIPLNRVNGVPNPVILGNIIADPNCFSFAQTIPGGFTPRFGADNRDYAIVGGVRGSLQNGLGYDASASLGSNKSDFFLLNSVNASLGPQTPRNFKPGAYEQIETLVNIDLTYAMPVSSLASDLNLAGGFEYRREQFDITKGDDASIAQGPLASQGFSTASNGFAGFSETTSNAQSNIAFYGEAEADITDQLLAQAALRWENYDNFGSTTNFKLGGLYRATEFLNLRATYSTGFHAPSAGQANVSNVTTNILPSGDLQDIGTLPLTTPPGQLAADYLESQTGVRPELGPERARNISVGFAMQSGPVSLTVDYFNIELDGRIALTDNLSFIDVLVYVAQAQNVSGVTNQTTVQAALAALANANAINGNDFSTFEDLSSFRFFTNAFNTRTQGVDVNATWNFDALGGQSSIALNANWTQTEVTNRGRFRIDSNGNVIGISDERVTGLQDIIPKIKGNLTFSHRQGPVSGIIRANYVGEWVDVPEAHIPSVDGPFQRLGAEILIDLEVSYNVSDSFQIIVGAENLFDNYPEDNIYGAGGGEIYSQRSPIGLTGGQYYVKGRVNF